MAREDELIRRIERGDGEAANELVGMFYPEILRYCRWHAPTPSLAEDATQETFLKVLRYFDRYAHQGKFKAFLYRIAANTCTDLCRQQRREDVLPVESLPEPPCTEPGYDEIHSDMVLKQLLRELPEETRELVLLRFGQDLTLRETAAVTGLPLRTVQSRLRAGLKILKKNGEKEDFR